MPSGVQAGMLVVFNIPSSKGRCDCHVENFLILTD